MSEQEKIIKNLKEQFTKIYGGDPAGIYFAPGRVNMIGEHTDYNGGHVFPCALSMGTYAAASRRDDHRIHLASLNIRNGEVSEFTIDSYKKTTKGLRWTDYPMGVIWAIDQRGDKLTSGADILFFGNIPAGSGLSSSASLEVLTGLVIRDLFGFGDITQVDLAKIGQQAENEYVGMNCGIMDQFASAMGKQDHAIFLDTSTLEYTYGPLKLEDASIVITNSNVKHQLASSEYNVRRAECEEALKKIQTVKNVASLGQLTCEEFEEVRHVIGNPVVEKRAKHAVYENQRTLAAVKALERNDIEAFGRLMNESHVSLRDDYAVSCPEIDYLTETAWTIPGVIGSRITGGGFGGCSVSIIKNDAIEAYKEAVTMPYKEKFGLNLEFYVAEPGEGARKLS